MVQVVEREDFGESHKKIVEYLGGLNGVLMQTVAKTMSLAENLCEAVSDGVISDAQREALEKEVKELDELLAELTAKLDATEGGHYVDSLDYRTVGEHHIVTNLIK